MWPDDDPRPPTNPESIRAGSMSLRGWAGSAVSAFEAEHVRRWAPSEHPPTGMRGVFSAVARFLTRVAGLRRKAAHANVINRQGVRIALRSLLADTIVGADWTPAGRMTR